MSGYACRYTVREIGFSSLANSQYSIVVIDQNADPESKHYQKIRNDLNNSNITLIFLNPETDQNHPVLVLSSEKGLNLPATILWSPEGRIVELNPNNTLSLSQQVLNSQLRNDLLKRFYNHFAFAILVESSNEELNNKAFDILTQSCSDINNRMPNMPKQVSQGAMVYRISADQWDEERILLWSLGLDETPETPQVIIIYGRGRIIGDLLAYESIMNQEVFRRLAMIGADCECGLDRKWMLGPQIPMNWPSQNRQALADELGFDVDNPMVLAEMSYILSKEQINNLDTDVSFAPEEIDLNELFGNKTKTELLPENQTTTRFVHNAILILSLSLLILAVGGILFFRRGK